MPEIKNISKIGKEKILLLALAGIMLVGASYFENIKRFFDLNKNIKNMVNTKFIKWRSLKNSFVLKNPMSMYEIKEQKLDALLDNLNKDIKVILQNNEIKLNKIKMSYVMQNPMSLIDKKKNEYNLLINTLKSVFANSDFPSISIIRNKRKIIVAGKILLALFFIHSLNPIFILAKQYPDKTKKITFPCPPPIANNEIGYKSPQ